MKSVGIRVLKNQLSRYLDFVRKGETVLVTDRDEVIAEIRQPAQALDRKRSRFEAFVLEGVARGELEAATVKGGGRGGWKRPPKFPGEVNLGELLEDLRGDRFAGK